MDRSVRGILVPHAQAHPHRYSVQGFIDKNRDALFQDFKRLLYSR